MKPTYKDTSTGAKQAAMQTTYYIGLSEIEHVITHLLDLGEKPEEFTRKKLEIEIRVYLAAYGHTFFNDYNRINDDILDDYIAEAKEIAANFFPEFL